MRNLLRIFPQTNKAPDIPCELREGTAARQMIVKSACIIAALFLFAGCGSGGSSGDQNTAAQDTSLGQATDVESLMHTSAYAGKLVVHFDESLKVRLQSDSTTASKVASASQISNMLLQPSSRMTVQTLTIGRILFSAAGQDTATATVAAVQQVLDAHPTMMLQRSIAAPAAEVERQREKLEHLSGQKMPDWNSVYRIDAKDPAEAVKLMHDLAATPGVKYVYPQFKGVLLGALDSTPSLTGLQGYLYDEATHGGLNASAGWSAGTHGENVYVVDNEPWMNFDHYDLQPLTKDLWWNGGNYLDTPDCATTPPPSDCDSAMAHGTAVAGILIAKDNSHGVTGFSPAANFILGPMRGSAQDELVKATNGVVDPNNHSEDDIEPGSVWIFENGAYGKYSNPSCTPEWDSACEYGEVPVELWPDVFNAIKQATAYGVTVIEGAANGSMNLNNPDLYTGSWSFVHNMATDDAGAIMVGASEGSDEKKISFSNCGTRVNTFAWGQGVVTTGYPYGPYKWNGTTQPIAPNTDSNAYFVDMFGGTSAATAMVAGVAVQIQSYARGKLGHKRYLMPLKMRQIIVNSGVSQKDTSGCNIGKQPRVDVALQTVDTFLTQVNSQYPELAADEQLTDAKMVALRQLGVGIICKEFDPANSDPSCPDEAVFPPGSKISVTYDFDGDGRADLVKFENGTWYVDLSSKGSGEDNYGSWDLTISFPPIEGKWLWPYVADMNSDGRADFVVYDKEHGKFYVALTDTNLIKNGAWHGWDWVIDYSSEWYDDLNIDPNQSKYSRPAIGDYNNDGYNDIAIVCSDGMVRVNYLQGKEPSAGHYDWVSQLIPDTLLAQAPGWAYLTLPADFNEDGIMQIAFKVPDGLPDQGRMYMIPHDATKFYPDMDWFADSPHMFGGNDSIPLAGLSGMINLKGSDGSWQLTKDGSYTSLVAPPPVDVYGGPGCHPIVADFDGDGISDRAVMCPDEWRIAYSSNKYSSQEDAQGVRHIPLGYDMSSWSLPGRSYSGGVSYAFTRQLIELYQQMHPGEPPPILMDMVTNTTTP